MQKLRAFALYSPEVILCFRLAEWKFREKNLGSKSGMICCMHFFPCRLHPPPERFHVRREGDVGLLARALRRKLRLHPLPSATPPRTSPAPAAAGDAAPGRARWFRAPSSRRRRAWRLRPLARPDRPERPPAPSAPAASRDAIQ